MKMSFLCILWIWCITLSIVTCQDDKFPRDCDDLWSNYKIRNNGSYIIDVDGEDGPLPPLIVDCQIGADIYEVLTIVHHDTEEITDVRGLEPSVAYERNISYFNATEEQLIVLINQSFSCQQYINWICKGSHFDFWNRDDPHSWWVGRNWEKQYYWGGAVTGSRSCGCHPYCVPTDRNSTCNCDAKNKKTSLEDSGLLLDSSHLPVLQLRFGSSGEFNEAGRHILGPLICRSKGHKDIFKGNFSAPVTIESPGYPNSYPSAFHRYTWSVKIKAAEKIELVFPDYDVLHYGAYNNVHGCKNVVVLKESEGNTVDIGRQGNSPPYFVSEGAEITVNIILTTCNQDPNLQSARGFRAVFRAAECFGCKVGVGENRISFCDEMCGIIASKGYPFPHHWYSSSRKYDHSWILHSAQENHAVELKFNDFDIPGTANSRNCTPENGVLWIYNSDHVNETSLIGGFCNNNRQGVIYSTKRYMKLVYETTWNHVGNGRGFHATFRFILEKDAIKPADFSKLQNVAKGKLTKQSSTRQSQHASLAVNGILSGSTASGRCTATNFEKEPWWQVNLQRPYFIYGVRIHNRVDSPTLQSNDPHVPTWPQGQYGLPMPVSGCPSAVGFIWYTGERHHDIKENNKKSHWSDGMLLKGGLQKDGGVKQHFCLKVQEAESNPSLFWMPGVYCIYQYGDDCPIGFESGYVTWYDKNSRKFGNNIVSKVVPKGNYNEENTTIYFCCRSDGNPIVPIRLPTDKPFYLLQFGNSCQKIEGMSEIEQYFHFAEEDILSSQKSTIPRFKAPHPRVETKNGLTLFYCYYDISQSLRGFRVLVDNTGIVSSVRQYYNHENYGIRHLEESNFQFAYSCADYAVTNEERLVMDLNCTQPVLGQYLTIQMYNRYDSLQICEVEVLGVEACGQPLGMASEEIYDTQIESTSNLDEYLYTDARLNGNSGWCATVEDNEKKITIDLNETTMVTGISLQGLRDKEKKEFIQSFHLYFSNNLTHWFSEEQPVGQIKVYNCNTCDPERYKNDMPVRFNLVKGIRARYVSLQILEYHNAPCLRMEILGCRKAVNCGENLTAPDGVIKSPNFPFYYGQDKSCWWIITPPEGLHVELNFIVYDIALKEDIEYGNGCQDQLLLYPGYSEQKYITSPDSKILPKQVTSRNTMKIHLKTCFRFSMSRYQGFFATYKFVDCPGCGSGDYQCSETHICDTECGKIVSIGYPSPYRQNHRCRWHIVAPPLHYINVTFHDFDIIGGIKCVYDYISFYDVDGDKNKMIGKYCNDERPPEYLLSSWNVLLIEFYSDAGKVGRGFSLKYVAQKFQPPDRVQELKFVDSEGCPATWNYYRGYCYKAFHENEPLQWYEAESKCVEKGKDRKGHLVSIVDKNEVAVVHYFLINYWDSLNERLYIGLNDEAKEGIYRWSDGNPMIFTDWSPVGRGLPTQPDGGAYQDCTLLYVDNIYSTALWHDVPCSVGKLSLNVTGRIEWNINDPHRRFSERELLSLVYSYICKMESTKAKDLSGSSKSKHTLRPVSTEGTSINFTEELTEKYFLCRNKEVISNFFVCNGAEDCRDGSDEEECGSERQEFSFRCTNGRSIAIAGYCDFKDDCGDGSDESRCAHRDCIIGEFQCRNGQCIPLSQRCDLLYNCHDRSDEESCASSAARCNAESTFECYDGTCIPLYTVCDGHRDCPGRYYEDETFGCSRAVDRIAEEEERNLCSNRARRTCSDLYIYDNIRESGYYIIDPDGKDGSVPPFEVYCEINETLEIVKTIMHHDSEEKLYVRSAAEGKGYYRRSVTYDAGMTEIISLINISEHCQQYIEWQCFGTGFDFGAEEPISWWVSRDDKPQYYWGGTKNNKTCGCYPYCLRPDLSCNCDAVDKGKETQDSGYIENKDKLPIKEVRFGNTFKTGQYGYHKIGPLECTGQVNSQIMNCTNATNYLLCHKSHYAPNKFKCIYEFDQYGYHIGCRDVTHLRDCEKFFCPKDYVKCPSSYCIPSRYVCDGKWDCISGADEEDCDSYSCPGQYKCYNKSSCVPFHLLCDGIHDCPYGDDEFLCDLVCPSQCKCEGLYVSCVEVNASSLPSHLSSQLRKLDFSRNNLDIQKADFHLFEAMAELILQFNDITELPAKKFDKLRNLYKLDLSNNKIHFIARSAFDGLRNLRLLHLENNPTISEIESESFYGLTSLIVLNLTGLRLSTLRKNTFWGMSRLKTLNISNNNILQVEHGAFLGLHSVTMMDMQGNHIDDFSHHMFVGMKSLEYLYTDAFKFCCVAANQIPFDNCWPRADEISSCKDLMSNPLQRSFLWVLGAIALMGNLFVIIWRLKMGDFNRVSTLLIISLGFADFLMGVYLLIIASVDVYYRGTYIEISDSWRKSTLCKICGFLSTVSSEVSVFTLVFITIDRLICLVFPFSQRRFNINLTYRLIIFSWIIASLLASLPLVIYPYFYGKFYARSGVCLALHITSQNPAGWEYSVAIFFCINFISFLLIFSVYLYIYLSIRKFYHKMNRLNARQAKENKVGFQMALIVFTNSLCWFPIIVMGLMAMAGMKITGEAYAWTAVFILPLNSATNPLIYTISSMEFQSVFCKFFGSRSKTHYSAKQLAISHSSNGNRLKSLEDRPFKPPYGYQPLLQFLRSTKPLKPRMLLQITKSICEILKELHAANYALGGLTMDAVFVYVQEGSDKMHVYVPDFNAYRFNSSSTNDYTTDADMDMEEFGLLVKKMLRVYHVATRSNDPNQGTAC